jgi:hypothetical protein
MINNDKPKVDEPIGSYSAIQTSNYVTINQQSKSVLDYNSRTLTVDDKWEVNTAEMKYIDELGSGAVRTHPLYIDMINKAKWREFYCSQTDQRRSA